MTTLSRKPFASYNKAESLRYPTPEPDYEDEDTVVDVNDITFTVDDFNHSVVLHIPEPDYDNDEDSSIADSKTEVGSFALDFSRTSAAFKHLPGYKGIQDRYGLNSVNGIGRTPDPEFIIYPPRLPESLASQSFNSSREYLTVRADDPERMVNFERCDYSLLNEYIMFFLFITLLLIATAYFYLIVYKSSLSSI